MVNAWSLAYDVINGTMDENFPVKKKEPDDTVVISTGSTDSATFVNFDLNDQIENITIDTSNHETLDFSTLELPDGMTVNYDMDPALSYSSRNACLVSSSNLLIHTLIAFNLSPKILYALMI